MMWYWGGGVHWWGWLLGVLAMVSFWAVLLWAVWYFVTALRRPPEERPPRSRDAKQILDERLARGELDPEEYRQLRDLLQGDVGRAEPSQGAEEEHPVGTGAGR